MQQQSPERHSAASAVARGIGPGRSVVRIRDVARMAGVSPSTVSRALNGDTAVRRDLRDRVRAAAAELGYRPNRLAQSLRRQRTTAIGVVVSAIDNHHFSETVRAVEEAAFQHGYRVLVCNTNEDPAKEAEYLRMLADERVGGIIISATDPDGPQIGEFIDAHVPVVAFDRPVADPRADTVVGDNASSVREATRLLIAAGRRSIACVTGWHTVEPSAERQRGYREAIREAGLTGQCVETDSRIEGGHAAVAELIARPDRPDALVVANNLMVLGAFEAIRDAGLRIPDDIALVGVDDPFWARFLAPPLTTLAQPIEEMAVAAMDLILEQMEGERTTPRRLVFPFKLIWRESAGSRPEA